MLDDWRLWCRLCAKQEIEVKHKRIGHLSPSLEKLLCLSIKQCDFISITICRKCIEYIQSLEKFIEHVHLVDKMYKEIADMGTDVLEVRLKYKIDQVCSENSIAPDPNLESMNPNVARRSKRRNNKNNHNLDDVSLASTIKLEQNNVYNLEQNNLHDERFQTSMDEDEVERNTETMREIFNSQEQTGLDQESESKHQFQCDHCHKLYSRRQTLDDHILFKHKRDNITPHQCNNCSKTFISKKRLQQHELTHLPPEKKFVYPCSYCDKKFTKTVSVQAHVRAIHDFGRPAFGICEECGKSFQTKGALKEHQITHTDYRPFQCIQCPKKFKTQARLKTHEDIHNNTSYVCPHCGLQLNTKRTLKMHLVVHSEEKKFKCQYCGNTYKRSKSLKNHLILHTGLRPYNCPFCEKTFANGSNCRSHKKKAHPSELAALEASGESLRPITIPRLEVLQPNSSASVNEKRILSRKIRQIPNKLSNISSTLRKSMEIKT